MLILGGDLNLHVGKDADYYDGIHEGFENDVRNLLAERILEMRSAVDMTVWIMFLQKHDTRSITQTSGTSKTHIDYTMMRNKDRKRVRHVKVIAR